MLAAAAACLLAVLLPGYQVVNATDANTVNGQTVDTNSTSFDPPATEFCPVGYYADGTAGLACVRCPYGATTLKNGSISADDCVVPPGYFARDTPNGGELVQCFTTPDNTTDAGYFRAGWKAVKEVSACCCCCCCCYNAGIYSYQLAAAC
jgi:hypothetical protein